MTLETFFTAGAPFLVKEVQAGKGDISLGVGLMFMLMIVTIFYVPIVLPLLLPGVEVNAWDIAKSLIFTMLVPIILGLLYRSHAPEGAQHWAPLMNKVSGIADVTDAKVQRTYHRETAAMGAGIIAAVGAGIYENIADAARTMAALDPVSFQPNTERQKLYRELFENVYRELNPALQQPLRRLAESAAKQT